MRHLLVLGLVLMLTAGLAFAQAGRIGIFGINDGTNCAIADVAGLLSIYVVHIGSPGATACQFSAPKPSCFTAQYLSDGQVFPVTVGNSQTGVSVGYGTCKTSDTHVLTIQYFANGLTPDCCIYPLLPDPTAPGGPAILMVDCSSNLLPAPGQSGVIESTAACTCAAIVPGEESSWGKIKSLYAE